jgi:hypothetical protein
LSRCRSGDGGSGWVGWLTGWLFAVAFTYRGDTCTSLALGLAGIKSGSRFEDRDWVTHQSFGLFIIRCLYFNQLVSAWGLAGPVGGGL